jgi:protoporphyrinogen oxidase
VWAYRPEELAWHWIGDRVAKVDLERVLENVVRGRDDVSWGPNNRFRFPRAGGTGAIWSELSARLAVRHPDRLRFRRRLTFLDTANHLAFFDDGTRIGYRKLLSSIPLDALVHGSDLAEALGSAAAELIHSSTHVVGVALRGRPPDHLARKCWMYFPEDDSPFYRVTVFSNYAPSNVPDIEKYWSLMAEVSSSPEKPVDEDRVVDDVVAGMLNTHLIASRETVHHTWYRRLDYGYPTPSLRRDAALETLLPALEQRDVFSRGRFGAWKYEVSNQDHSFAQGVELVEHWLFEKPEQTLREPELVNARRPSFRPKSPRLPSSQR